MLANQLITEGSFNPILQLQQPEVWQLVLPLPIGGQIVIHHRYLLLGSLGGPAAVAEDVGIHLILAELDDLITDDVTLTIGLADDDKWKQAFLLHANCCLEVIHDLFLGVAGE